MLDVKVNFA